MSFLPAWRLPAGGTQAGATATGTNQGTALAITQSNVEVTTTASGTGVVLPSAIAGMRFIISNQGANTLAVYPALGGQIDGLGANAAYSMDTLTSGIFFAASATQWYSISAGAATASGDSIKKTIVVANAFAAGDIVRLNGSSWAKAQADSAANAEALGVIESANGSQFTIVFKGLCAITGHGKTVGSVYFLDASTAGAASTTEPSTAGQVSVPVYVPIDADSLDVDIKRGMVIPAAETLVSVLETQVFN